MSKFPTLIKPPPASAHQSPIEDVLELTHLEDINPNLFTNTRPLWHPPGARGIYGGAVIAQCLAAAQRTVAEHFIVHSMHCYFVLNGNAEIPVIYHVERVREGRSFATRTVQARQRGQPIFTVTLSFAREGSGGKETVDHAAAMRDVPGPEPDDIKPSKNPRDSRPFVSQRIEIANKDSPHPHEKRLLQWIKAEGRISDAGGHQAHLSALAYMSDSYFIGTVARAHKLWRYNPPARKSKAEEKGKPAITPEVVELVKRSDYQTLKQMEGMDDDVIEQIRGLEVRDGKIVDPQQISRKEIGMMVSLDHTIYFHRPKDFRADEWLFTEMETPWAGDGRGLVYQRIYTKEGLLVASCVQEGVVRLRQDNPKL